MAGLLSNLWHNMAFADIGWQMVVMWGVVAGLVYLAVYKNFEPLLLLPIAFGALLANLPAEGLVNPPAGPIATPETAIVEKINVAVGTAIKAGRRPIDSQRPLLATLRNTDGKTIELRAATSGRVVAIPVREGERVERGQTVVELGGGSIGGLFYYLSQGLILQIFPPLIFLGIGALTDFAPLIANPRMFILGAGAKLGIFMAFACAVLFGFTQKEAAAVGIIGGADGPVCIYLTSKLAAHLLGPIAVAAYSYMALIPLIQPPIMRALTTDRERKIKMRSLRKVSRLEKLLFIFIVTVAASLVAPSAAPLLSMLMLGNLLRESGVTPRLQEAAQTTITNTAIIFIGVCVGITMNGESFLSAQTLKIIFLGIIAFIFSTVGGILTAKVINLFDRKNLINPLIGSAGVSAIPMAARTSQAEGQKADIGNYLLMHAMGVSVAGVIGSALAAGFLIAMLGG